MFKKVLFILLTLALPLFVFAQTSGKLIGMVQDKETGEPLPGVNIVLQGTFLGATTDVDGYYVILNVPVGAYTVEATYVGYSKTVVENVRVSSGITTEQNFELAPTTLELGEVVVVTAERPLVEKHVTHSAIKITSDQIVNAPIRGLQSFMELMPSVVVQNGAVNIRGGRGEEVGYYLDGASTMDPVSRTNAIHVIQEGIEEFQVLTGGFGAEYGNANSGIVKTELRQGTSDLHFSITGETDDFQLDKGDKFLGTYSYYDHLLIGTVSGAITKNIRFFVAGEKERVGDFRKRFTEGFEFNDRVDVNPANADVTAGNPDTVNILYKDGFTPRNNRDRLAVNSTLSFNFDPIRFRLSGIFNNSETVSDGTPLLNAANYKHNPMEHRYVTNINNHALLTGKLTHVLSSKTYYDLNVSYYYRMLDQEDSYFGNDWQKWADSAAVYNATFDPSDSSAVVYRDAWRANYDWLINGIPFSRPGGYGWYQKSKQTYIGAGLDFVSQVGRHHEMKFGFGAKQYTIRQFQINPLIMGHTDPAYESKSGKYFASLDAMTPDWYNRYMGNTYGYDVEGEETDADGRNGARTPLLANVYLSDKIEYSDLIINAGLRLDYFDADDYTLRSPDNAKKDQATGLILESEWQKVDPHIHLSPRLGISFPVSETTNFYTQYGKFVQMPEFNDFYYNDFQYGRQIATGGFFYINPVGYGFNPIYTTSYELGFRKQIGNFAAVDIAGFYKNVKGQIQTTRITAAPGADITTYNALQNGDFSTNKGLELKLTLRRWHRIQGQMNYTLTSAEGTGSGETGYISAVDRAAGVLPTTLSPLDYSQTHRGSVMLDYRFGKDDGGPILEQLGMNLIWQFNSGHPYTRVINVGGQQDAYTGGVDYMFDTRSRQAVEPVNASTTPWVNLVDLRVDKSFSIMENLDATVYVRVTNLLNAKNVLNVYMETGSDTDDGFITDPERIAQWKEKYGGEEYVELYKAVNTQNGQSFLQNTGTELWGQPRQIMFGLKLNY